MTLKIAGLSALIILPVLGGCAASSSSTAATRAPDADENAVMHTYTPADYAAAHDKDPLSAASATLFINGMGCPLCVSNVDKQLERVKGIDSIRVDLGAGTVHVGFVGKTRPSPAQLAEAVDNAGLTLVKIRADN